MKVFHVSPVYNRKSITKNGLVPTVPKLEEHAKTFQYYGLLDSQGRCTYTWVDSPQNEKFIRDMIYCIVWIHPRNSILIKYENDGVEKIRKISHRKPIYPYSQMEFDVYCMNIESENSDFTHSQTPSDEYDCSLYQMDERYSHTNKQLKILNTTIQNPKIVGKGLFRLDKYSFTVKIIR